MRAIRTLLSVVEIDKNRGWWAMNRGARKKILHGDRILNRSNALILRVEQFRPKERAEKWGGPR